MVDRQQLLFTETWRHSKFDYNLCKICWDKHHTAFVKVVEGSEIYNFPIHHSSHFSWKFLRKTPWNRSTPKCSSANATPPTRRAARRPRVRAPTALGIHAAHLPRPHAPSQGCPAPLDTLGLAPRHAPVTSRAGPPVRSLPPRTRRPEATVPRCCQSHSSEARGSSPI
jgi:hypothetical protein